MIHYTVTYQFYEKDADGLNPVEDCVDFEVDICGGLFTTDELEQVGRDHFHDMGLRDEIVHVAWIGDE